MTESREKYSIMEELQKCYGYDIALMTTFNFEIPYFERAVLPVLNSGDVRKISLFIDSNEFTKALQDIEISHLGRKYMVNPVRISSSFHPKVFLLLGERKAKLIIGSANIKTSGFTLNHEVFNFIEYSPDHSEYRDVIVDAIDFFHQINEQTFRLDNEILQEAKECIYYRRAQKNGQLSLLHNMSDSILSQIISMIPDPVKKIKIAVPYYDNSLGALNGLSAAFPDAELSLYIQIEKSTFPTQVYKEAGPAAHLSCFDGFTSAKSSCRNNFYHGKVLLFITDSKSYVLYGSTNCTQAAIMKSFSEGGNIECDFFEIGEPSEFDSFFSQMNILPTQEIISNIMTFPAQSPVNFFYKYGEIQESLLLHIGYSSRKEQLRITLGGQELKHQYTENELIVEIPEEVREYLTDIFSITLSFGDAKEDLRCWTVNISVLKENRMKQSNKDSLEDFHLDSDGERFLKDRINLLKAEITCLQDLQEHARKQAHFNQIRLEQEEDTPESEDFIIDVQIPDEYREEYKRYTAVSRIRSMFFRRFIQRNTGFLDKHPDQNEADTPKGGDRIVISPVPRKATPEEIKFERFVKGKAKGMLNDNYVDRIGLEHYIGLVDVVMGIFRKYHEEEQVENIFQSDYVVKTRTEFLIKALEKNEEVSAEFSLALKNQCLLTLFDNYRERDAERDPDRRWEYDTVSRRLLSTLEKKYHIRSSHKGDIYALAHHQDTSIDSSLFNGVISYFETLYGAKSPEMLSAYIGTVYDNAKVTITGNTMKIEATSTDMFRDGKPNTDVLREINRFSRSSTPLSSVRICITSIAPNPQNKNVITQIRHNIDLSYRKWDSLTIRKDGSKSYSKTTYLHF